MDKHADISGDGREPIEKGMSGTYMESEKTMEWQEPYGDIVFQLSRALAAANRYLMMLVERSGLTGLVPSHGSILVRLEAEKDWLSMTSLAHAIGKDPSTVTSLVKKLRESGYVRTRKSQRDGRIVEVALSEGAKELAPQFENINEGLLGVLTGEIPPGELNALRDGLVAIETLYTKAYANATKGEQ